MPIYSTRNPSSKDSELTIATLVKAVLRIAVVRKDDDLMATVLQSHGGIDDKPLGTADAQIRVEKDNRAVLDRRWFCLGRRHGLTLVKPLGGLDGGGR
jgi:hypothetical protein